MQSMTAASTSPKMKDGRRTGKTRATSIGKIASATLMSSSEAEYVRLQGFRRRPGQRSTSDPVRSDRRGPSPAGWSGLPLASPGCPCRPAGHRQAVLPGAIHRAWHTARVTPLDDPPGEVDREGDRKGAQGPLLAGGSVVLIVPLHHPDHDHPVEKFRQPVAEREGVSQAGDEPPGPLSPASPR